MKQDEALKMAIEALKNGTKVHSSAILAIEEALAREKPTAWVGLTDEEVERIVKQCDDTKDSRAWYKRLTNAVERTLKEKNT